MSVPHTGLTPREAARYAPPPGAARGGTRRTGAAQGGAGPAGGRRRAGVSGGPVLSGGRCGHAGNRGPGRGRRYQPATPDPARHRQPGRAQGRFRARPPERCQPARHRRDGAVRLTSANALEIVEAYDLVVDAATTSPRATWSTMPACSPAGRTSTGLVYRWEGQLAVFATEGGPCYRCLFREPPPPGLDSQLCRSGCLRGAPRRDRRGPGDGDDQAAAGRGRGAGGPVADLRRAGLPVEGTGDSPGSGMPGLRGRAHPRPG